ncbi:helix-turn-helix domain-containing protein [Desulfuromonas thiophila]|uniref:helix-turn-helix domain-containing protein n=1 Tax=Desulfuromonas thiophila TaxID=57664 RepID=UPI0029F5AFB4|nr:helix-turn-helix domain-containing protein [Desulfuromonas thiophila]
MSATPPSKFAAEKPLYQPREVAALLGYRSLASVYTLIKDGYLQCHSRRPGTSGIRITGCSLERYINTNLVAADHYQK